jgi:hypothetical protein
MVAEFGDTIEIPSKTGPSHRRDAEGAENDKKSFTAKDAKKRFGLKPLSPPTRRGFVNSGC